jgi:hypothetical protein
MPSHGSVRLLPSVSEGLHTFRKQGSGEKECAVGFDSVLTRGRCRKAQVCGEHIEELQLACTRARVGKLFKSHWGGRGRVERRSGYVPDRFGGAHVVLLSWVPRCRFCLCCVRVCRVVGGCGSCVGGGAMCGFAGGHEDDGEY